MIVWGKRVRGGMIVLGRGGAMIVLSRPLGAATRGHCGPEARVDSLVMCSLGVYMVPATGL